MHLRPQNSLPVSLLLLRRYPYMLFLCYFHCLFFVCSLSPFVPTFCFLYCSLFVFLLFSLHFLFVFFCGCFSHLSVYVVTFVFLLWFLWFLWLPGGQGGSRPQRSLPGIPIDAFMFFIFCVFLILCFPFVFPFLLFSSLFRYSDVRQTHRYLQQRETTSSFTSTEELQRATACTQRSDRMQQPLDTKRRDAAPPAHVHAT